MKFEVAKNLDPSIGTFMYNMLLEQMVASGKYTVVDWEEIDRVLKYVSEFQPNISEAEARKKAIDQLEFEKMYLGSIMKIGSKYHVTVKIVNLDLTVEKVEKGSTKSEDGLEEVINDLASKLLGSPEEVVKRKKVILYSQPPPKKKSRLYVKTDPTDARVRILNIKPLYKEGIELSPGSYHIEVSRAGYLTEKRWIRVKEGKDAELGIQLAEVPPAVAPKRIKVSEPRREPVIQAAEIWREPITGMEFVWVPGGCYQMGCGSWTEGCDTDEYPVHEVCVDGFWIGKYEVTQGQWQQLMGSNPSYFPKGDQYPVEKVSWNDVQTFIYELNRRENGDYRFRLPTEAEWEYACVSGGKPEKYSGGQNEYEVAWFKGNSEATTHPVGRREPNGLGIHDMSGNVWEWCEDIFDENAYGNHQRRNPVNGAGETKRVNRGGSWYDQPRFVRCSVRGYLLPDFRYGNLGFRLVRNR
jgi:formylglycine-generating enzyme required for sulfatase activity